MSHDPKDTNYDSDQAARSGTAATAKTVLEVKEADQQRIDRAIGKLKSLNESGAGIVEVLACGSAAIPALQTLLFEREPSGLPQIRCRVVDALSALKAYDVVIEYLSVSNNATDPVEQLGNDAVIGYAAWAVARTREERVFELLLRLAERPSLGGVIGALGSFGRPEAIPLLIGALEEDVSRNVAQFMLRRIGIPTRTALASAALKCRPSAGNESESSRRRRRSCLALLVEIGPARETLPQLKSLLWDNDDKISVLACKVCLRQAPAEWRREAVERLVGLLPHADWLLRQEIESCLTSVGSLHGISAVGGIH